VWNKPSRRLRQINVARDAVQLLVGLFLIVATASAIAQLNPILTTPSVPDLVPRASPETTELQTPTFSSASSASLPDAPSHTIRQHMIVGHSQPDEQSLGVAPSVGAPNAVISLPVSVSTQFSHLAAANSAVSSSLVFGGSPDTRLQTNQSVDATGKTCGNGAVDKAGGSDWITSLLSITSHKGQRYCALGEGGFWKRGTYAAGRAFVAHRYDGANSSNLSDAFGLGIGPGIPGSYTYQNYAGERLAARYASAVGRDTLKNMFSEFWPDIATHVLHRRP
jgi:hypothetical protein